MIHYSTEQQNAEIDRLRDLNDELVAEVARLRRELSYYGPEAAKVANDSTVTV